MRDRMVQFLWRKYHKWLWCFRCYVWNWTWHAVILRFKRFGEWLMDQADLQVRKRVGRWSKGVK